MILFKEDWLKYPGAIANVKTTNTSFVRLASVYKEMGIENYAFILALHDPRLVGVDPFDPNLTLEQIIMITAEAKANPWFFVRECVKAPPISGIIPIPYQAHRGNIALWWLFFNHITTILIQIRQTGKSFASDSLSAYLMNVRCNNTQINLLTKDDTLRKSNIERIKNIEDNLPYYFKQRTSKDINNTEMLTVKANNNVFMGHVPQKSPKDALKVGRGLTSPIFFIDEAPFQPNIEISLPAALTAGTQARKSAALNNEPYGTIITTTSGKKDDKDGKFIYEMLMESASWSERFYDAKDANELDEMVRKNSTGGKARVGISLNHRQLGKTDQWLKDAIEGAEKITPEDADRDFFNIWTAGTLLSPLSTALLEKIRKSAREPDHDTISKIGGYITRWYIPEDEAKMRLMQEKFVLAMDTSDAQGNDDISLILMSVTSGETIAAGNYNETNLFTFAEFVAQWLIDNENVILIPERKSSGVAIIDLLLRLLPARGIDPFRRIFNRVVNDYEEYPERYEEIDNSYTRRDPAIYIEHKKHFGFATSSGGITARSELYSTTLQNAAKRIGDRVYDEMTVNQITSLVKINGRVDHQKGEHDDMVISWLLAFWLITQGKNLSYYGIDHRSILSKLVQPTEEGELDPYTQREQMMIRDEMDDIYNRLKSSRDEFISDKLEHKLRYLNTKLIKTENEVYSIDELINSIKESKRKNRILGNVATPQPTMVVPSGYVSDLKQRTPMMNPYYR